LTPTSDKASARDNHTPKNAKSVNAEPAFEKAAHRNGADIKVDRSTRSRESSESRPAARPEVRTTSLRPTAPAARVQAPTVHVQAPTVHVNVPSVRVPTVNVPSVRVPTVSVNVPSFHR
jgi:hypothetical protein